MTLQQQIEQERDAFYARVGRIVLAGSSSGGGGGGTDSGKVVHIDITEENPPAALSWSPTLDCGKVTHEDAAKAVAKLNKQAFQGHTDWRLPEIRELLSLVDYSRTNPAIDTAAFPDTKSDWYWSSSPCAGDSDCAWFVDFHHGYAHWGYRGYYGFVRAVRGPVARARQ